MIRMIRGSGILLHITSLPSPYGIGSIGGAAYDFIDALHESRQKYWQILPLTPTEETNNPYKSLSAFASNPLLIDLDLLVQDGLLEKADLENLSCGADEQKTDFAAVNIERPALLYKAYENGIRKYKTEFLQYVGNNEYWLIDYALFMALTEHFGHPYFEKWDSDLSKKDPAAIFAFSKQYEKEIERIQFWQFLFEKQWAGLKRYAAEKEVNIIGDIPIYVAPDSADAWARPELFLQTDVVSGVPPDKFSSEGQYWGNPLYDWEYLEKTGFEWWHKRIKRNMELYHYVRIDHFRGFESCFMIPKGAHPKDGWWEKCPGEDMFNAIKEEMGELPVIVEDLGHLNEEVFEFIERCGFMGTKVLQFAFDQVNSIYLPHNYKRECAVYTGTHDNDTTKGWFHTLKWSHKVLLHEYIGDCTEETVAPALIRLGMESVADICITPMQDVLNLPGAARMNVPSVERGNWEWRMPKGSFTKRMRKDLKNLTRITGRGR